MKTIPIFIVFEDEGFKKLKPVLQFYVLQAVYRICREDKEQEPIPNNLRYHLRCSEGAYFRNIATFRRVLNGVMPKIAEFKLNRYKQTRNATLKHTQNAVKRKYHRIKDVELFDNTDSHVEIIPVFSPREKWNPGAMDYTAAKRAKESNEAGDTKLFTDD